MAKGVAAAATQEQEQEQEQRGRQLEQEQEQRGRQLEQEQEQEQPEDEPATSTCRAEPSLTSPGHESPWTPRSEPELGEAIRVTAERLAPLVHRTPLSEALLRRPPFKYLFDLVSEVGERSGFGRGLLDDVGAAPQEKAGKAEWLALLVRAVEASTGRNLDQVRPGKVIAGKRVPETLFLLRMLAKAATNPLHPWPHVLASINAAQCASDRPEEAAAGPAYDPSARRRSCEPSVQAQRKVLARESVASKIRIALAPGLCLPPGSGQVDAGTLADLLRQSSREPLVAGARRHSSFQSLRSSGSGAPRAEPAVPAATRIYVFPLGAATGPVRLQRVPLALVSRHEQPKLRVLSIVGLDLRDYSFPEHADLPPGLATLALSRNSLSALPALFTRIPELVELRMDHNKITHLCCAGFPKLRRVHLEHNRLENLPDDLLRLKALQYADLSYNMLQHSRQAHDERRDGLCLKLNNQRPREAPTTALSPPQPPPPPPSATMTTMTTAATKEAQQPNAAVPLDLRGLNQVDESLFSSKGVEHVIVGASQLAVRLGWAGPRRVISPSPALELLFSLPKLCTVFIDGLRGGQRDKAYRELGIGLEVINVTPLPCGLVKFLVLARDINEI